MSDAYTTVQGTDEWQQARCGLITASRIADVIAKTKSGYSASRKNYLAELLVERVTGDPTEHFTTREMQRGTELEPEAREVYEKALDVSVQECGFIIHPEMHFTGASPDGLVNLDGGVEIKCPNTAQHISTLRGSGIPHRYYAQIQWNIECSGRDWWDYVSYDPRMKDSRLIMYVERIDRDDEFIQSVRKEVSEAEAELQEMVADIMRIAEGR